MAKWRRIVDELWEPEPKVADVKACRKRTLRRIATLADHEKADAALIKAGCRACGCCWLAST